MPRLSHTSVRHCQSSTPEISPTEGSVFEKVWTGDRGPATYAGILSGMYFVKTSRGRLSLGSFGCGVFGTCIFFHMFSYVFIFVQPSPSNPAVARARARAFFKKSCLPASCRTVSSISLAGIFLFNKKLPEASIQVLAPANRSFGYVGYWFRFYPFVSDSFGASSEVPKNQSDYLRRHVWISENIGW